MVILQDVWHEIYGIMTIQGKGTNCHGSGDNLHFTPTSTGTITLKQKIVQKLWLGQKQSECSCLGYVGLMNKGLFTLDVF